MVRSIGFWSTNFITKTKEDKGHALNVRGIGDIDHQKLNKLYLLTMAEEHETGANHMNEAIHGFINGRTTSRALPSTISFQLSNRTCKNKNRYLFEYLERFIYWGVCQNVETASIPGVQTHEGIDQA